MMGCPNCGAITDVDETRDTPNGVRRRRRCRSMSCDHRFTTFELIAPPEFTRRGRPADTPDGALALVPVAALQAVSEAVAGPLATAVAMMQHPTMAFAKGSER